MYRLELQRLAQPCRCVSIRATSGITVRCECRSLFCFFQRAEPWLFIPVLPAQVFAASPPQAGQKKGLQNELISNRELLCSFFKRLLFFAREPVDDFFPKPFGDGDSPLIGFSVHWWFLIAV